MPAAAVGVISAAASAYAANKNAQAQSAAMGQQQNAANSQLALQQQFMNQQNAMYGPLANQLVQEASGDKPLDYGLLSGGIQNNYDTAQRNLQGYLAQRGMSASGLGGAGATGLEIGRAGALAGAFQQGLERRRQLGLGLLTRYNPRADVQGVAGAQGNLQNLYGSYAGMYGQAAQQGWGAAAQGLGSAVQGYMLGGQQQPGLTDQDMAKGNQDATQLPSGGGQFLDPNMFQPPQQPPPYTPSQPLFGASTPFGAGGGPGYFGDMSSSSFSPASPAVGYNLGAATTGKV